ncbi:MAG: AI-2E family transporter [Victivallales bacterium]|nr:AI-2E family transporter [Victivallales bacterium]
MSNSPHQHEQSAWASNIAKGAFLSLTVILFCAAIYLIRAELDAIILGILLAGVLTPMHKRVLRQMAKFDTFIRQRVLHLKPPVDMAKRKLYEAKVQSQIRQRSAIVSVALVFLIIVIPASVFFSQLAKQGVSSLRSAMIWLEQELPHQVPKAIEEINRHELTRKIFHDLQFFSVAAEETETAEALQQLLPMTVEDSKDSPATDEKDAPTVKDTEDIHLPDTTEELPVIDSQRVTSVLVKASRNILSGTLKLFLKVLSKTWLTVFNFFLMLFVMFFVFYDGENIMSYARKIIPLGHDEQQQVLQRIREVSSSITFSIFGTALCQALLAMVIFRIVGIPALFWGSMLGMCSIIPMVGTTLIWIPATIYLFATGQIWQGWFVLCACGLVVAQIDNILRPFLMKKAGKTGMSYLVLFFSILGGLQTFGLIGIVYGPLIFGICGICLLLFSTQFKRSH